MKLPLVDIKKYGFIVEPRYFFYGWKKSPQILTRESVAQQLKKAKKLLPRGYNFKIWDSQRTRETQILMLQSFYKRIKVNHSTWTSKKIWQEVFKFGAKPVKVVKLLGTHRLGGSLDMTIVDQNGEELYLGTDMDDLTGKAALDYYEKKKKLAGPEKIAKKNRRLLKNIMIKSGFRFVPHEWWHWSYDK